MRLRDEAAGRGERALRSTTGTLVLVLDAGRSADCEARTPLVLQVQEQGECAAEGF